MKTRIHQWLLGLMLLLILLPGSALACLLLIGAIGSSMRDGFEPNVLPPILVLLIAPALVWWACRLMFGLRNGFQGSIRRKLLAFYLSVAGYCGFWLFAEFSRDASESTLFAVQDQIIGAITLAIPILIVLCTKPEAPQQWNPLAGGELPLNRWTDRFVRWLAGKVR